MEKTKLKFLVSKLEENQDGKLTGGFSAIKGGFRSFDAPFSDNGRCTNSTDCANTTNSGPCTNGSC